MTSRSNIADLLSDILPPQQGAQVRRHLPAGGGLLHPAAEVLHPEGAALQPSGKGLGEAALASALKGGWLSPGALVVLEERAGVEIALPAPLDAVDIRAAGETQLIFARLSA